MKIWQVIIATLVIFGAGVVAGGVLVSYSDRAQHRSVRFHKPEQHRTGGSISNSRDEKFPQAFNLPPHGGLRTNFVEKLQHDLKLTPEQHLHIEKIVAESQERTRELWKQAGQPFRKEVQETKEKIRAELTPEQREKFEELTQRVPRLPDEPQSRDNRPHNPRDQRRPVPQNTPTPPVRPPENP